MLAPNSRIAVGITPGNKLMFAMTRDRIYLGRLAKVMRDLGCADAMNLDAGTSTGFYCNGRMLARPGRWLTNAIVVHVKPQLQESSAAPPRVRRG
jgi:exopolysaccharide biosynthesis protein